MGERPRRSSALRHDAVSVAVPRVVVLGVILCWEQQLGEATPVELSSEDVRPGHENALLPASMTNELYARYHHVVKKAHQVGEKAHEEVKNARVVAKNVHEVGAEKMKM